MSRTTRSERGTINQPTPCPRCGAPSRGWVLARDRSGGKPWPIRRCNSCHIGFTARAAGSAPAAPTALPAGGIVRALADGIISRELRPLTEAVEPNGAVLDIGAGGGDRALVLVRAGYRVTAVEPDLHEAARACDQLQGRAVLLTTTAEALPPDATGYDGALLSHVLEHLAQPDRALQLISDRLRPGGRVAIMVPNAGGLQARVFRGRWHQWEPSRHRWHFTAAVLAEMLRGAGYRDVRVRAAGGWRYPASLAYSLFPRLDPQAPGSPHAAVGRLFAFTLTPVAFAEVAIGRGSQLVATARRP